MNIEKWNRDDMVEIKLNHPDDFLKLKETLTRIGIGSHKSNTLFQSCHILHKQGKYYIVHFKEMFCLDGKTCDFKLTDLLRRNAIIKLLLQWNMCSIVDEKQIEIYEDLHNIKIIKFSEKDKWELKSKYTIGS